MNINLRIIPHIWRRVHCGTGRTISQPSPPTSWNWRNVYDDASKAWLGDGYWKHTKLRPGCSSVTDGWRPLASARQLRPTNSETRSEMQRVHEAATINTSPCSCVSGFTRPGPARPGPVEEAREELQHSSPCYATQSLHHWNHRQLCPTLTKDSLIGQKEKRSSLTNDAGD